MSVCCGGFAVFPFSVSVTDVFIDPGPAWLEKKKYTKQKKIKQLYIKKNKEFKIIATNSKIIPYNNEIKIHKYFSWLTNFFL